MMKISDQKSECQYFAQLKIEIRNLSDKKVIRKHLVKL